MGSRKPKWKTSPSSDKKPRTEFLPKHHNPRIKESPENYDSQSIAWQLHRLDHDGAWGWNNCGYRDFFRNILHKLKGFDTMSWQDLKKSGSHSIPIVDICKEAQDRLVAIRQEDIDELFSLRLSGQERIWGIRDGRVLRILWWDPKHSVCISNKRHT